MIGFDIDGVVIDIENLLQQEMSKIPSDKQPFFQTEKENMEWEIITKHTDKAPLMPRAKEYLKKFHEEIGGPLIFITARNKTHHSILRKYFIKNFGNSFEYKIVCTGSSKNKLEYVKKYKLKTFVDDNPDVVNKLASELEVVFLIRNVKNKNATMRRNVIVCNDLQDVYNKFKYKSKHIRDEEAEIENFSINFVKEDYEYSSGSKNSELVDKVKKIKTISDMNEILQYSNKLSEFRPGKIIIVNNKMQSNYSYVLKEKIGNWQNEYPMFKPELSPDEMLNIGVFEGKYLNDCVLEYPREWFKEAIKNYTLSPGRPNPACNFFSVKSRQSLGEWKKKRWVIGDDSRGWFEWYCRFYLGRRDSKIDIVQIKRWAAFGPRHIAQLKKYCIENQRECRPKQRQALLQWGYDSRKV